MSKKKRAAAIFDFDGTLIPGDSIVPFLLFAWKEKKLSAIGLLSAAWAGLLYGLKLKSAEHAKSRALAFLSGMDEKAQEAFCRAFIERELLPRVFPDGVKCILRHRAKGDLLIVISASSDCYMRYLGDYLPFHAVLATPTDIGGRVQSNCRGQEKVRRLRLWLKENGLTLDKAGSFAYGNSLSDVPVMGQTAHPVCVNPVRALRNARPGWERLMWRAAK